MLLSSVNSPLSCGYSLVHPLLVDVCLGSIEVSEDAYNISWSVAGDEIVFVCVCCCQVCVKTTLTTTGGWPPLCQCWLVLGGGVVETCSVSVVVPLPMQPNTDTVVGGIFEGTAFATDGCASDDATLQCVECVQSGQ